MALVLQYSNSTIIIYGALMDRVKAKQEFDRAKIENVKWFSRFTVLQRLRIARNNRERALRFRALALKNKEKDFGKG